MEKFLRLGVIFLFSFFTSAFSYFVSDVDTLVENKVDFTANGNEEYILMVATGVYIKFEYDPKFKGLIKKKQLNFFPVLDYEDVCPIDSNKFVFTKETQLYILDTDNPDLSTTPIQFAEENENPEISTFVLKNNDISFFIVPSSVDNKATIQTFTLSGEKKRTAHIQKIADENVQCVARKVPPFNILCIYYLSDDAFTNKYVLFDKELNVIVEGKLYDVGLEPDKSKETFGLINTMFSETVFLQCIIKDRIQSYLYCNLGNINADSISKYATTDLANINTSVNKFSIGSNCSPLLDYISIAPINSEKFCSIFVSKTNYKTLVFSVVKIMMTPTGERYMAFEIEKQSISYSKTIRYPHLVMLKNELIGLFLTYDVQILFRVINGANCRDLQFTNRVGSDYIEIPISTSVKEKLDFYSTSTEAIKVRFTSSDAVKIYVEVNSNPVEINFDDEYSSSETFYFRTLSKVGTDSILYAVSQSRQVSRTCTITFEILPCHPSCYSCTQESTSDDSTQCVRGCSENYYPLSTDQSQCYHKTRKVEGFYVEHSTKQFLPCDPRCLTCNTTASSTESNCEKCNINNGYFPLDEKESVCISKPSEYFYIENNRLYNCQKGKTKYLYYTEDSKQCVESCTGKYKAFLDTCVESCPAGTKLQGNQCLVSEDTCFRGLDNKAEVLAKKGISIVLDDSKTKCEPYILQQEVINEDYDKFDINMKECIDVLKKKEGIDESDHVILVAIVVPREDQITNQIEYLVFSKDNSKLELSECDGVWMDLYTPINKNQTIKELLATANYVSQYGYDIFNSSDPFYVDVCTPFKTEDNTDISVEDRKKVYYKNLPFCEENCIFRGVNLTTNKVHCECQVKSSPSLNHQEFSFGTLSEEFTNVISRSNLRIIKCYKLVFNGKNLMNNIGSWLMMFIFLFQIACLITYFFIGIHPLVFIINSFFKQKPSSNPPKKKKKRNKVQKKSLEFEIESIDEGEKEEGTSVTSKNPSSNSQSLKGQSSVLSITGNSMNSKEIISMESQNRLNGYKFKEGEISLKSSIKCYESFKNEVSGGCYTDEELNKMNFENSLVHDKRSFCKCYYSLLKYKQLIIFTFVTASDFNLKILKFSMFMFSLAMFFTLNILFYTDSSMTRNYQRKGKFSFIYSLPQTIFSSITCAAINFLLRFLSLSQKGIQSVKEEKVTEKAKELSKKVIFTLKIKIVVFFSLVLSLMLLFWYYNSAFCVVFKRTQKHIFLDAFISFVISMLYPFGLSFITASFRILSLRKKVKCLFFISSVFSYL